MTLDLKKLREVNLAATQGKWQHNGASAVWIGEHKFIASVNDHSGNWAPEDAAYIAAFDPPTTLALLDRIEELRRNSVPRSRHDAMNQEINEAAAKLKQVQDAAHARISALEAQLKLAREKRPE